MAVLGRGQRGLEGIEAGGSELRREVAWILVLRRRS